MKIGIFSGTFDPFHNGHLKVCLSSAHELKLDKVLVLLEKNPNLKTKVTPHQQRQKIIELSISDYPDIEYIDTRQNQITFEHSPKKIQEAFPGAEMFMIIGEDLLEHIEEWVGFDEFNHSNKLVVISRSDKFSDKTKAHAKKLGAFLLPCVHESASSSKVKKQIHETRSSNLVNQEALHYILDNNIY
ncbi:MAG: adenylyltransferase/cytidyltransferase family protein [bacterium]|nr:adenylyltransferase/cytidyltransferase family protein [bacterium]